MRILGTLVLISVGVSALAAPTTYPLKCRSGASTVLVLNPDGELRFPFTKGSRAAGSDGSGLKPGECSWVDRVIGPSEPSVVAAAASATFQVGVIIPHTFNSAVKPRAYATNRPWVTNFQTTDTILTVYAYNDGQGLLRVPNP